MIGKVSVTSPGLDELPTTGPLSDDHSCDGCGVCCMQQGSPPGYLYLLQLAPEARARWPDPEDVERIERLPREALARINRYVSRLRRREVSGDGPCIWLNQETRQCRFHEHRPEICRNFMVQGEGCASRREEYGLQPLLPVLYEIE
jgi:Fe-S-cluster containining protein